MSKRARITLAPEAEQVPQQDEAPARAADKVSPTHQTDSEIDDSPPGSFTASALAGAGTVVKVLVAGLAVVSLVLLWRSRRP